MIQVPPELIADVACEDTSLPPLATSEDESSQMEVLRNLQSSNLANNNTEKTTRWAVNAYSNWRAARLSQGGGDENIPVDPSHAPVSELNYWLSQFIQECRQRDGREYKHQNLYAMVCGISRHIRKLRPGLNILDDQGMKNFKSTLYGVMKRLQTKQVDLYNVQTSKITRRQWDYLWEQGFLGDTNATSLFYAVYFLFITITGVTSALQLRSLTPRNLEVTKDTNSNKLVTIYYPSQSSNKSERSAIRCTEDPTNPRSFGRLLQLYLSKLPPFFPDLWVRPNSNGNEWYSRQPIGQNILRTTVKSLCQLANFSGSYSNQSLGRDLLNWDLHEIEHLMTSTDRNPSWVDTMHFGIPSSPLTIKRELSDHDHISSVTINTHLNPKRRRSELTNSADHQSSDADSSPQSLGKGSPSRNPPRYDPSSDIELVRRGEAKQNDEAGARAVSPSTRSERPPASSARGETSSGPGQGSSANFSGDSAQSDSALRDVQVDISDHINQCLGLFKDCTIQNVTINIYLNKDKINQSNGSDT